VSTSIPTAWKHKHIQLTLALVVSLFALTGAPLVAQSTPRVAIDNFGQVNTTYFRGAQPVGHDYDDLASSGVKTLIDLTSDDTQPDEPAMAAAAGLKYFHIPMTTHVVPTAAQVTQFMALVNDPQNLPVYVHCVGGSHRTGVMTAVYRMVHDKWTPDRAFAEMRMYKFGPDFLHAAFKSFVLGYRVGATTGLTSVAAGTKVGS
jgi:protein tyrosine/serine phosphatase